MKSLNFLLLLFVVLLCLSNNSIAQKNGRAVGLVSPELFVIGPDFFGGDISNTLTNTGVAFNIFDVGLYHSKMPGLIFGLSPCEFSEAHIFDALPAEQAIMSTFEITTTTTTQIGSSSSTETLEKISMEFMRSGLFIEYQPFISGQQKMSPFIRFSVYTVSLKNSLPAKGEEENRDVRERGGGISIKLGSDIRIPDSVFSMRIGYVFGTLPDFEMDLLSGLRQVNGGTFHSIYLGIGMSSFKNGHSIQ